VAAKKNVSNDNNASDFIRAQPVSMTAPEVIQAGKRAGFDFSTSLVYAVRGRMKKGGSSVPPPAARDSGGRKAAPAASNVGGGDKLETQVRALVDEFVTQLSALVRRAALDAVRQALGQRG